MLLLLLAAAALRFRYDYAAERRHFCRAFAAAFDASMIAAPRAILAAPCRQRC